mgnify:CR=1 FL=1
MKKKRILVLVLQFVLLVAVMGGVFMYTQNEIAPTQVLAFRTDLAAGETIRPEHLAAVEIPRSAVTEKFVRKTEEVVGKLATTKVSRGQYVMADLVVTEDAVNPLVGMDLSKMRTVSFPVEMPMALAGKIQAGDTVDLVYIGSGSSI